MLMFPLFSRFRMSHSSPAPVKVFVVFTLLFLPVCSLELYGCYLPDEYPSEEDIYAFQSCVEEANGISSAEGGRWGRSLRRINARTLARKTYKDANEVEDRGPQKHNTIEEYANDLLKYFGR